jgi:uncharacterized protein YjbI with pentapeptide repeats
MNWQQCLAAFACVMALATSGQAQIYRWDTGELIPGTEGIEPGPGMQLTHWNRETRNLRYAEFSGDLSGASLFQNWFEHARFNGANLANVQMAGSRLMDADLSESNLADASLWSSTFTRADLNHANLTNASLRGSTLSQVNLSGANLTGVDLEFATLTDANLSEANLSRARLGRSTLTGANLSGASVTGVDFSGTTTRGFTDALLASTASYEAKNLTGVGLQDLNLSGWDLTRQDLTDANLSGSNLADANLSGANLTSADFSSATLTDANLSGAIVAGVDFSGTTWRGFTEAQLASTASYQAKDLRGIRFWSDDLTGWDLSGQNLSNADLSYSTLSNTNLTGSILKNAYLRSTADGIESAVYSSDTIYNQWTVFPDSFDPVASGLTLMLSPLGDVDATDILDVTDLEMLQQRIRGSSVQWWLPVAMFDVNSDGNVNQGDVRAWVKDLQHTWFGDANLDGEFTSADLVQVFAAGKYEATEREPWGEIIDYPATWSTGDWNTDGEFTSSDLVLAFQDGGYEAGPRATVAAVPEPSGIVPLIVGLYAIRGTAGQASREILPKGHVL